MSLAPADQVYWKDWCTDKALQRCSWAAQGILPHVILYIRQCDEFGVCRETLAEIAHGSKTPIKYVRELAQKGVLKGGDQWQGSLDFAAKHAGRTSEPVTLVKGDGASCWFIARLVRDKHVREQRGKSTRFTPENQPGRPPTGPVGTPQGDGPASASASASASILHTSTHTDSSLGSAPGLARVCRNAGYSECSDKHPDLVRALDAGVSEAVMAEAAKAGAKDSKPISWVASRAIAKAGDTVSQVTNIEQAREQREANDLAERERKAEDRKYTIQNDFSHGLIDGETRDERLADVDTELRQIRAARASS